MRRIASIGALQQYLKQEFKVSDLFYSRWEELSPRQQAEVYTLWLRIKTSEDTMQFIDTEYGVVLLLIMRQLRKNQALIDRINEAQVVDCFNEIKKFLDTPWYNFPVKVSGPGLTTPADKMGQSTFDHFIYADNEYSLFLISKDEKHLRRLVATLYQKDFDKESVEGIAAGLKLKEWQLLHVFYTFKNIREFVMKRCKTLLPATPAPGSTDGDGAQPAVPTGAMWLKLKHRLAETPAFAGFDKAGRSSMYSALDYLEDLAQIAEKNRRPNG